MAEQARVSNQYECILGVLSGIQMQTGYIWLIPVPRYVKKIQRTSEHIMLCISLYSVNGFLILCSRSLVIAAAEIQPFFRRPLDTTLAQ